MILSISFHHLVHEIVYKKKIKLLYKINCNEYSSAHSRNVFDYISCRYDYLFITLIYHCNTLNNMNNNENYNSENNFNYLSSVKNNNYNNENDNDKNNSISSSM